MPSPPQASSPPPTGRARRRASTGRDPMENPGSRDPGIPGSGAGTRPPTSAPRAPSRWCSLGALLLALADAGGVRRVSRRPAPRRRGRASDRSRRDRAGLGNRQQRINDLPNDCRARRPRDLARDHAIRADEEGLRDAVQSVIDRGPRTWVLHRGIALTSHLRDPGGAVFRSVLVQRADEGHWLARVLPCYVGETDMLVTAGEAPRRPEV